MKFGSGVHGCGSSYSSLKLSVLPEPELLDRPPASRNSAINRAKSLLVWLTYDAADMVPSDLIPSPRTVMPRAALVSVCVGDEFPGSDSDSEIKAAAFARAIISDVERWRLGGMKWPLDARPPAAGSGSGVPTIGSKSGATSGIDEHVLRFWLACSAAFDSSAGLLLWELPGIWISA